VIAAAAREGAGIVIRGGAAKGATEEGTLEAGLQRALLPMRVVCSCAGSTAYDGSFVHSKSGFVKREHEYELHWTSVAAGVDAPAPASPCSLPPSGAPLRRRRE